jgi:hypothetical protein
VTHRATATVDLKSPDTIEKVLILSCSHRAERGATQLLVDRLQKGMERAGADVAVMFPSKMDIHPCCGRFLCWRSGDGTCVHRDDDMSTFFEVFRECDLLVWATPVYFYHGTAWMKILMERLFALDDHSIVLKDGLETHPVRIERWPHQALLATSGFADRDVFIPLKTSLRCMLARKGRRPMAELVRPAAMTFLIDKPRFKTKDEVLLAVEEAGEEMVSLKRVSKATKKSVEQPLMPFPMQLSAGNFALDRTLERGDFVFEKKR